jgi:carboxymethylenebutenolidase
MGEMIDIHTSDNGGAFSGYVVRPAGSARGAIIVIQEIFGVNAGIRAKCDKWAKLGYLAIAPDLFWRIKPGIELNPDIESEFQQAFGYFQAFDQTTGIADIAATIAATRALVNGRKIGLVGYCLGGRLAYMAAARTDVDASVGYYGVMIENLLGEAHAIGKPLLLHFAELDHFVSADKVDLIEQTLLPLGQTSIYRYPGVDHGFAAESGKRRDDASARLADERTTAFFAKHLG